MSVLTVDPYDRERASETALWTVAALVVVALHVGLALAYLLLRSAPEGQAEAPVVDVAFMPAASAPAMAAPEAPPAEPTPQVEQSDLAPAKTEPVETRQAVTEPEPPPVKAEQTPPPEPVPPPVALQMPEPAAQPDQVTVMQPPAKPAESTPEAKPEKVPEQSARKPATNEKAEREKLEKEKAEREKAERAKHKTAPPKPAAAPGSKPAQLAMAPNPGADSEGAKAGRASWESELAAHIRRFATYAANGNKDSGTVRVGVTIDRNGRLLSHRLAGSSGSAVLDSAGMAVIERAQPYPRFPPGMTQAQIALTIPLHLRPQ
ncbi:energy transducer TonB [Bradyrhizobium sp. Tv2a-2]|uniref:energy transducer TonB family protein n=1 Tax=Bradyrhizobium sp. Tv2a-2 TaxID=113395 RepID=UPI00041A7D5D|nr:energy transducer TonB [Bradyrhizobium sp. Tv2a-2]